MIKITWSKRKKRKIERKIKRKQRKKEKKIYFANSYILL